MPLPPAATAVMAAPSAPAGSGREPDQQALNASQASVVVSTSRCGETVPSSSRRLHAADNGLSNLRARRLRFPSIRPFE